MKKPVSSSKYKRATPVFEGLEQRILFSADLPGIDLIGDGVNTELDISSDDILDGAEAEFARLDAQSAVDDNTESGDITLLDVQSEALFQSTEVQQNSHHELVIIDANVADYSSLVDNLQAQLDDASVLDVVILDANINGIDQLSAILAEQQNLDALHLNTHGSLGEIQIGNGKISLLQLQQNSEQISNWGNAFASDADMLIYGCDLASDTQGELFIDTLARLTATDVAASDDLTGNISFGGDWELEYQTGQIDALYTSTDDLQASWQNLLSSDVLLASSFGTSRNALTITVPSAQEVNEDSLLNITGISVNGLVGSSASAQLEVASGNLKVALSGGAIINSGSNGSSTFTLNGTQTQINAALATLSYQGDLNFYGDDTLTLTSSSSSVGAAASFSSDTVAIKVNPINDAPEAESETNDYVQAINDLNPVGYWQLDQTVGTVVVNDASATNGSYVNGVGLGVAGAISGSTNTAADFDGTDDYISLPHEPAYLIDNGMIQLWFNADNLSGEQTLIAKDHKNFEGGGHLYVDLLSTGELDVRLQSTDTDYFIKTSGAGISAAKWYHMAFTFGDNGMELYLNGTKVGSNDYTGGLKGNENNILVGATNYDTDIKKYFNGKIDEVAIFANQVNAESIQDLYAAGVQYYTVNENSTLNISAAAGVLANDFDVDGDALTAILVSNASHGSVTLSSDGSFDYTPNADFNGTDSFTYKVNDGTLDSSTVTATITVNAVNEAASFADQAHSYLENQTAGATVATLTASDVDGIASFTFNETGTDTSSDGFYQIDNSGVITITAAGVAAQVNDFESGTNTGDYVVTMIDNVGTASDATITLNETNVDDNTPTIDTATGSTQVENVATSGDTVAIFTASDLDGDAITYSISSGNDDGYFEIKDNTTGVVTLTVGGEAALADDALLDATYTLGVIANGGAVNSAEATVNITFDGINDTPVAVGDVATTIEDTSIDINVISNDSDIDGTIDPTTVAITTAPTHGSVSVNVTTGEVTYTPDANYHGADSFEYTVKDNEGLVSDPAKVTLTVNDIDEKPIAVNDMFILDEDTSVTSTLTTNDNESGDGDNVWAKATDPIHGSVTVNTGGTFTYIPDANYSGSDSFTYTITDADGDASTANVNLTVNPIDDITIITGDTRYDGYEEDVVAGTLNASDADGLSDGTYFSVSSGTSNGNVEIDPETGEWTFVATDLDWFGRDSFTVSISDDLGNVTQQIININLNNVEDSAVISGVYTGVVVEDVDPNENTLLETSGSLTITDADAGEASFIAGKVNGIYGDLLINSAGDWRYSADNTQDAIQQLDTLELLTDSLTVISVDGTSQNVIITIKGAADDNGVINNTPIVHASVSAVQDNSDLLTSAFTPVANIERSTDLNENTAQSESHGEAESANVDLDLEKSAPSFIDVLGEQTSDYNFSLADTTVSEEIFLTVLSERSTEIKERDVAKPTVEITPTFFQEITSFWKDDGITAAKRFEADQFEFAKSQSAQNSPEFRYDLNKMSQQLDASAQAQKVNEELSVEAVTGVSMTVAAGFASWMLRGGTLLASFLTAMPTWRSLDLLPILAADEESKTKQTISNKKNMNDIERDTEAKVDELFDQ